MEKDLGDLDAKRLQLTTKLDEAKAEDADVEARLDTAQSEADPYLQRRRQFEELKASVGAERVEALERLVETHDEMKKRETEFKVACKDQLAKLRETLDKARSGASEVEDAAFDEDADADASKLKGQIERENEKASKLKTTVAKKSRQLRAAERRLDEIPSRAELDQYQKRFLELYDESAAIHR